VPFDAVGDFRLSSPHPWDFAQWLIFPPPVLVSRFYSPLSLRAERTWFSTKFNSPLTCSISRVFFPFQVLSFLIYLNSPPLDWMVFLFNLRKEAIESLPFRGPAFFPPSPAHFASFFPSPILLGTFFSSRRSVPFFRLVYFFPYGSELSLFFSYIIILTHSGRLPHCPLSAPAYRSFFLFSCRFSAFSCFRGPLVSDHCGSPSNERVYSPFRTLFMILFSFSPPTPRASSSLEHPLSFPPPAIPFPYVSFLNRTKNLDARFPLVPAERDSPNHLASLPFFHVI